MAKSLFSVLIQSTAPGVPAARNVLAQPDPSGKQAMRVAIDHALQAAGAGAIFQGASELGGGPADQERISGGPEKAFYLVQFRPNSGANNSTPPPMRLYVNPPDGQTTEDLAIEVAAESTGAIPSSAHLVGRVDIDAT